MSTAPAHSAPTSPNSSSSSEVGAQDQTICYYTVNASGGLNVRSTPGGTIVGSLADGSGVWAHQNRTETANGVTYRQLSNGNWAAASYLNWDGADCASPV